MRNDNRKGLVCKRWSSLEDYFVTINANKYSKEDIAAMIGRSVPSVVNRMHVFGIKPRSRANVDELRQCSQCKEWKSRRNDFYENKAVKDGLASNCKLCASANTRKNYQKNIEARRATARQYLQTHPEQVYKNRFQRRQYEKKAAGKHTHQQWMARVELFGWCCRYCRQPLNHGTLTKDHVIPLSRGGSEWASNLVPACKRCNYAKKTKSYKTFMELMNGG